MLVWTCFYNLVRRGVLPKAIHIGGNARWDADELETAIDAMKAKRANAIAIRRRGLRISRMPVQDFTARQAVVSRMTSRGV